MSDAQFDTPTRADAYADLIVKAAQTAADLASQNAAVSGKDWYRSKGVLGSSVAALGVTLLPSVLAATHASPETGQAVTSAVVLGGALLGLVGRLTARRQIK
ncbi:LPXTG cell wall anchor domain-containing protein [Phenylobacterium aquaticum]|uniref:LPXTG cell wall anchor domain-containing protein n=1 Tax=Phenylobacterium aquaticum TaxID=1763816 RepID=UPI001F5C1776|nr:LPXTG cell wall anchor domain-containing protein [Phenylobacterium aquaticum]MCI3134139.1 LPXTG cell wall anchor domain-containing protein [Phenylobacterium aquaticum]